MNTKNPLFKSIISYILQHQLIANQATIVVGLSGGPDSMFLLHFLHAYAQEYGCAIIAAHINHKWRPEADAEELLCKSACEKLGITFESASLPKIMGAAPYQGSKEAYARTGRRLFFENIKAKYNAHAIALAHHVQDQQETFFLRLLRGSSLTGLIGMKPKYGPYIRPLLPINKKDILAYLHEHNIAYATDTSNDSDEYLRNRIRNTVIPALISADNRFDSNFARTLTQLQEAEQLLEELTGNYYNQVIIIKQSVHMLDIETYNSLPTAMRYRILLQWLIAHKVAFTPTTSFFNEINRFIANIQSNSHQMHTNWKLVKQKNLLIIKTLSVN